MLALFARTMTKSGGVRLRKTIYCDIMTMIFFFRLRMCLAEGALIESGKTKTSNYFTLIEHNYLRPRFTVLSLATRTCFFISCKYMICTIFTYSMLEWLFFGNGTSVRLTVKSFNYFLYKMCLSYFVISALNVSACNL